MWTLQGVPSGGGEVHLQVALTVPRGYAYDHTVLEQQKSAKHVAF